MQRSASILGNASAALALLVLAAPAQAQFGGLVRDIERAARDNNDADDDETRDSDGCEEGSSQSVGARILGGIMGRTARDQARRAGLSSFIPVAAFSDQLSTAIACRLDPQEQGQAANATLEATRGGADGTGAQVGATSAWTSDTREGVSGRSTVTARQETGRDRVDCITVSDVIIVSGEETRADKRMCRAPEQRAIQSSHETISTGSCITVRNFRAHRR